MTALRQTDLASRDEATRIRALARLRRPLADDVVAHVAAVIAPGSSAGTAERSAAIDVVLRTRHPYLAQKLFNAALSGPLEARAQACVVLATLKQQVVSEPMLELLRIGGLELPQRRPLAEHLLLVPDLAHTDEVRALLDTEADDETATWLAGRLALASNSPQELRALVEAGRVPEHVRSQLEFADPPAQRLLEGVDAEPVETEPLVIGIRPRVSAIVDPDVRVVASGPAASSAAAPRAPELPPAEHNKWFRPRLRLPGIFTSSRERYRVDPRVLRKRGERNAAGDRAVATPRPVETRGDGAESPPATPRPRRLEAQAPEQVAAGGRFGVKVQVALAARPRPAPAVGVDLPLLSVPAEGAEVLIDVTAPGLALLSDAQQPLQVPADGDSDQLMFSLRAEHEGAFEVLVGAWLGSRSIGRLAVPVHVVNGGSTSADRPVTADVNALRAPSGELSLVIDYDAFARTYGFTVVHDGDFSKVVTGPPMQLPPRDVVEGLVRRLDDLARTSGLRPGQARELMRNEGIALWTDAVPEPVRKRIESHLDEATSLSIIATDDPLPWELLCPVSPNDPDSRFLVERLPVLRGLRDVGTPELAAEGGPLATVVPAVGAPSTAAEEAALVRQLWRERAGDAPVGTLPELTTLLQRGEFGALHFACHNTFDPARSSSIAFGNELFGPTALAPMRAVGAFKTARPLVFLNACRSTGQAPLYAELAGWAEQFLHAGAGVFVGSAWSVRDASAKRFAETFYRALVERGETLGSAALAARQALAEDPDDPTWLAYTVYGDPHATVAAS